MTTIRIIPDNTIDRYLSDMIQNGLNPLLISKFRDERRAVLRNEYQNGEVAETVYDWKKMD